MLQRQKRGIGAKSGGTAHPTATRAAATLAASIAASGARGMAAAPILTQAEELQLAKRSLAGDPQASQRLVQSHLRFVISIARKYRRYGVPMQDLVQEGIVGLMHAVRKFDPQRDNRLSTYAMWWIRAAIQDHVLRSWSVVRTSTATAPKALFFRVRRMMAELRGGADALTEDVLAPLAKKFGMEMREVMALARRAAGGDRSLHEPAFRAGDNGAVPLLLDRLADDAPSPEDHAIAASDRHYRKGLIARALEKLPLRERTIIKRRYLGERAPTRDTIAVELGISTERVRQLELRALGKLRQLLLPLQRMA
ncbi:MAG: RNA polymerase factor sigma-32 [Alphaproteobacteria bacterium]